MLNERFNTPLVKTTQLSVYKITFFCVTIKRSSQQKRIKILNSKFVIDIKREQVITVKEMEGAIVFYEETIECYI